jgi:hypothetical protein
VNAIAADPRVDPRFFQGCGVGNILRVHFFYATPSHRSAPGDSDKRHIQ